MKKIITLFAFIMTFILSGFLLRNVHGQEVSTVYEINNYEIGDVFHYYAWGSSYSSGYISRTNIEILDKYFSSTGDSLLYSRQISRVYSSPEGTSYNYYIDTAVITNLDSLINGGDINSVYSDPDLYNNRIINYYESYFYPNNYIESKWVEGCGRAYYHWYIDDEPYDFTEEEVNLIYYLKGEEEWGEPFYVDIPEIIGRSVAVNIYPNPSKEFINVDLSNFSQKEVEIYIYSTLGRIVNFIKTDIVQNYQIDISYLPKGIYMIQFRVQNEVLNGKFIKE